MKKGQQKIEEPLERFLRKVKEKKSGCIEWNGAKQNGYGVFTVRRKRYYAHRYFYEKVVGIVDSNLVVDHICRNRSCVNTKHLRLVTQSVNASENTTKSLQVKCKRGHSLLDTSNLLKRKDEARTCKMCHNIRMKKYKLSLISNPLS